MSTGSEPFGQPAEMPWPDVDECRGSSRQQMLQGHSCAQCDGSHEHQWATWRAIPEGHPLSYGPGLPVRCKVCGGRKCDRDHCWERRHHSGPHVDIDGKVLGQVGSSW